MRKCNFEFLARHRKSKFLSFALWALFLATANNCALASFVTYNGNTAEESAWQTAAGTTVLENFESYSAGTQISSLPLLGISFDSLAGGGHPNTYLFGGTPHGSMQLANFPNGINETNRWNDIVLHVIPGYQISALGFWNGDGQSDTLVATVYDASDNILGSVGAFKDTFAGFISDVAISRVVFGGVTGDGWNHLDGLQTNVTSAVPEPETYAMLLAGLGLLGFAARHRKQQAA
jgi:hypothetical protein